MFLLDLVILSGLLSWCMTSADQLGRDPRKWGALVLLVWFGATGGYQIATTPEGWRKITFGSTAFGAMCVLVLRSWLATKQREPTRAGVTWTAKRRREASKEKEPPGHHESKTSRHPH